MNTSADQDKVLYDALDKYSTNLRNSAKDMAAYLSGLPEISAEIKQLIESLQLIEKGKIE